VTYCLGVLVDEGLLLIADTRTNAGIDNVSSYRKLHALCDEGDRQIFMASSGSLSATQSLLSRLCEPGQKGPDTARCLSAAGSMFEVAEAVGARLREANQALLHALAPDTHRTGATLLLGGRIDDERPRLFLIYAEGNFIECKTEVPFLQIGETRYGRPVLNRVLTRDTPLSATVKMALISFDSAMRSNLAIARPLDVVIIRTGLQGHALTWRIEEDDPYFNDLSRRWSSVLADAADQMPEPCFMSEAARRPLTLVGDLRA
jgi:putative proteasome-type protease